MPDPSKGKAVAHVLNRKPVRFNGWDFRQVPANVLKGLIIFAVTIIFLGVHTFLLLTQIIAGS